jgi:hypothetical protein
MKLSNAIQNFVNGVGDVVGSAVEVVGHRIKNLFQRVGSKVGGQPFFLWLGGAIKGVLSVLAAAVKGVLGIAGGAFGGLLKIVGGAVTGRGSLVLEGLWDMGSPIVGTVIVVLGKTVSMVQSVLYLQGFERPLTEHEKSQLHRVFTDSLNYYVIGIIEGRAGLFGSNPRAFTLGNTLYMKTPTFPVDLLVHEATHVWQYQKTGDRYASDALAA